MTPLTNTPEVDHEALFQCPGEPAPIPRSVHLSRLAAAYHACRTCSHRHELGHLSTVQLRDTAETSEASASIFTRDGVRGLYCNQVTRTTLSEIAAVAASIFWEEVNPEDPLRPRLRPGEQATDLRLRRQRRAHGIEEQIVPPVQVPTSEPRIVLGYDARSSSPDLTIGVADTLRKWGCHVLDIGSVSRPELDFATLHTQAKGGVYVTGGVSPSNFNGLDIIDERGWSWTLEHDWEQVEKQMRLGPQRPVRRAGHLESIRIREAYGDSLRPHWKGLQQMAIGVITADPTATWVLPELTAQTAVTLHLQQVRRIVGGTLDPPDSIADDLYELMVTADLDLGFIIGSDGRSCYLMDDRGEILLPEDAIRLLQFGAFSEVSTDHHGRYWLQPGSSRCDAMLTLARLLHSCSRSDQPLSAWLESQRS